MCSRDADKLNVGMLRQRREKALHMAVFKPDNGDTERGHGIGPDDARLVVPRLDDGANQTRHADEVKSC